MFSGDKHPDILFIAITHERLTTLFDKGNPIEPFRTPRCPRTFFSRAYCLHQDAPVTYGYTNGYRPTTSVLREQYTLAEIISDAVTIPKYFELEGGYATHGRQARFSIAEEPE